ncbi:MAG: sigma-70 family RNA polymerase sigma factor, partial [Candidatus Binatia bacterium]
SAKRNVRLARLPVESAIRKIAETTDVEQAAGEDFTMFYGRHHPALVGSLVLYTGDRELAMDLAQETMARAYRDWRKVSALDTPAGWLHRVAFNLANSAFRRRRLERRSSSLLGARAETAHHDTDAGSDVAVRSAVAALPKRQKTALVLRYYADLSVGDVAEVMGCAEGTVRALTSQALQSLRRSGLAVDTEEKP